MKFSFLKYITVFTIPLVSYFAMHASGWVTLSSLIYGFVFIPLLELLVNSNDHNHLADEEPKLLANRGFDIVLYLMVPTQLFLLWEFLWIMKSSDLTVVEYVGVISSMGISCGVIGINVAHELGHRKEKYEQWMAQLLLLTSLYLQFFIEHNRGHHKNVATSEDPSSARRNESVFTFWFRSIGMAHWTAWGIEAKRLKSNSQSPFSLSNQMLRFQLLQLLLIVVIYWYFGLMVLFSFIGAALIGILLLETVNYIEHYGLERTKKGSGLYERVQPWHSWNSNHMIGRLVLFELSRHSDHHYKASRKYQILINHEGSPQLPTGYPGMMLLSMIPPLWFAVMNKRIDQRVNEGSSLA
ncbi:MAG: alkane 1-monooxygenase [Reichenbachiella sp.]